MVGGMTEKPGRSQTSKGAPRATSTVLPGSILNSLRAGLERAMLLWSCIFSGKSREQGESYRTWDSLFWKNWSKWGGHCTVGRHPMRTETFADLIKSGPHEPEPWHMMPPQLSTPCDLLLRARRSPWEEPPSADSLVHACIKSEVFMHFLTQDSQQPSGAEMSPPIF